MSAPLIFVRDGRTLPYITITKAALERIRERCTKGAYAIATYTALLELANEDRADRVAVTQKLISEHACAGRTTIQAAITELVEAGLVVVVERVHGNQRLENEYVVVEPDDESDTPARDTGDPPARVASDPRPPDEQRTQEGEEDPPTEGPAEARASTSEDEFPEDLPDSLHEAAVTAGKILKRTALTRGQKREVTRAAVGHAILTFLDRDHVKVARDVEFWLLHGKGARKSCSDIVARYRNFLESSDPAAGPPLPAGVTPMHGRPPLRNMSNADRVEAQIQALRAAGGSPASPTSDTVGSA